jgi:hypothetical protein
MNILFTSVGDFLTFEAQECLREWKIRYQNVGQMSFERVAAYLRLDPSSALALVDAIVCMADTDMIAYSWDRDFPALDFPLEKALALAKQVRDLPEGCAMRDGRKWRSIPFVIFCGHSRGMQLQNQTHARIYLSTEPVAALDKIEGLVNEYQDRVLDGYRTVGFLVCFEKGRTRIRPALTLKDIQGENEYYFAPKDRRKNKRWVTVKRDNEGLRQDVELFQMLLDKGATETQMHRFFEEHPAILMQARMGIPISHGPRFSKPKGQTPDFSISPILGPQDGNTVELLELKGPGENVLKKGLHGGFSGKVKDAVDQVRDYDRYLSYPENLEAVLKSLGYVPTDSKLAVLIGRRPEGEAAEERFATRQSELDVKVVTYDEILQTQVNQLELDRSRGPYTLRYTVDDFRPAFGSVKRKKK